MTRLPLSLPELLMLTLIALVVVMIAIPQYILADIQANITQSKSNIRRLCIAMEEYSFTHGSYPPEDLAGNPHYRDYRYCQHFLTTPVSYLLDLPSDPFGKKRARTTKITSDWCYFSGRQSFRASHGNVRGYWATDLQPLAIAQDQRHWSYAIGSMGPNLSLWDPQAPPTRPDQVDGIIYDPTNGSMSQGNLWFLGPQ